MSVAKKKIENIFSTVQTPQNSRWKNWLEDRLRRGRSEVFSENVDVGPALAELLMDLNKDNRPIAETTVRIYARQMREGRWELTGESLKISKTGRFIDGQHRAKAAHDAGVVFPSTITFGLEDDVQSLLDTGKKRTPGDIFGLRGVSNSIQVAAAIGWVMRLGRGQQMRSASDRPSNDELYEFYDKHKDIADSMHLCGRAKKLKLIQPGVIVALHYLFSRRDRALADRFFDQLLTGVGFADQYDPVQVLRQRLVANLADKGKLSQWYIAALTIKAWNKARAGEPCKTLRWAIDEEFPVIA